jgi:two-component system sensor histidine kinase UhpB
LVELIAVEERERQRIAHELHSEIGQDLTAALLTLQFFAAEGLPADEVAGVADCVRTALERVRALSIRLRPPLLDEIGLEAALRSSLDQIASRRGLRLKLEISALPPKLPATVEISVFRLSQSLAEACPRDAELRCSLTVSHGQLQLDADLNGAALPTAWRAEGSARAEVLGAQCDWSAASLRLTVTVA